MSLADEILRTAVIFTAGGMLGYAIRWFQRPEPKTYEELHDQGYAEGYRDGQLDHTVHRRVPHQYDI